MLKPFIIYFTYAYNENDSIIIVNCHYTYGWNSKTRYNYVLSLLIDKQYDEFVLQCQLDNVLKIKPNGKFHNVFKEYIDKLYNGVVAFKGDIPEEVV